MTSRQQQYSLELVSDTSNVSLIEPYLNKVLKNYHLDEARYGDMLVVLTEAVTNAIVHGNERCCEKLVRVRTECAQGRISFLIEDEGSGFDPNRVPDPTTAENVCKPGGRGVFLMRHLSDDCCFEAQGKAVRLEFKV